MTALQDLAMAYGIDVDFWDWQGTEQHVGDATLVAVLGALGIDAATPAAQRAALAAHRRAAAARVLPPSVVTRQGVAVDVQFGSAAGVGDDVDAYALLEDGTRRELAGTRNGVVVDGVPDGYHQLVVRVGDAEHRAHLIVTPQRLALPAGFDSPGWGLAVQLYSVLSRRSWGVGDLGDLARLGSWCSGEHGADFVLVNPLHAAEVVPPMDPSPYSPTTRRFANPIYLDVTAVAERLSADADLRRRVEELGEDARAHELPDGLLDRDSAWAAKRSALEMLFAHAWASAGDDAAAFARFREREGDELQRFATWCALSEVHGGDWRSWPAPLHDPHGSAVRERGSG